MLHRNWERTRPRVRSRASVGIARETRALPDALVTSMLPRKIDNAQSKSNRATTGLRVNYPAVFQTHNPIAVSRIHFRMCYLNYSRSFIIQLFEHIHNLFALR